MENEMPMLIMQKMPRPVIQQTSQQQQTQSQGQPGTSRAMENSGNRINQPMAQHHMPPPAHPPPNAPGGPPI